MTDQGDSWLSVGSGASVGAGRERWYKYRLNYIECLALATDECAIFALTAWLTLGGMWLGAGLMERLVGDPAASTPPAQQAGPPGQPLAP